jgi:hypothetical protein
MARRDWISWTDYAETKGFEKGHMKGLEQAAINAINAGYDDTMVSVIGNMTAEQARALRQKVAPK